MRAAKHRFLAFVALLALAATLLGTAAPAYTSTAKLFGVGPLHGSATCISRPGPSGPYRVDVDVTGGQPSQTLNIEINGDSVGQVVTDDLGAGHARINHIASPLAAGDTITVASLTGVFFDRGETALQRYDLRGSATNIAGVRYVMRYHELFVDNALERRWEVTITNAEPGQSVPTFVRGVFIRPLLPGSDGKATLRMRTAAFINPDNNPGGWIALPSSFPSLEDGEAAQVGTSFMTMHRQ